MSTDVGRPWQRYRILASHAGNTGSNPVGDATKIQGLTAKNAVSPFSFLTLFPTPTNNPNKTNRPTLPPSLMSFLQQKRRLCASAYSRATEETLIPWPGCLLHDPQFLRQRPASPLDLVDRHDHGILVSTMPGHTSSTTSSVR